MNPPTTTDLDGIDLLADTWGRGAPHDQFDVLRRLAPVYRHPEPDGPGFWAVLKHADVRAVSRDNATFSSEAGGTLIADQDEAALAQLRLSIINMDPPKHSRYRRIVASAFTPKVIRALVDDIERRAAAIVDGVVERGRCEFVGDVAAVVPIQTIGRMIGLDDDLWPRLYQLSSAMLGSGDPADGGDAPAPELAAMEIYALCDAEAAKRRADPRDDLMTALVQAEVDGERLDDLELNLFFLTLLVAGNESTRNLLAHSLLALIDHPDQARRLRDGPSLWDTGVEEMLRWGSSIHSFRRTATRDTELRGVPIAQGDKVVLYYASANRDEDVFDRPHTFDVGRSPNDHLTFGGGGIHTCLGSSLARTQIRAVMRQVNDRLTDVEVAGTVERLRSDFMHGIVSLPITFTAARDAPAGR